MPVCRIIHLIRFVMADCLKSSLVLFNFDATEQSGNGSKIEKLR